MSLWIALSCSQMNVLRPLSVTWLSKRVYIFIDFSLTRSCLHWNWSQTLNRFTFNSCSISTSSGSAYCPTAISLKSLPFIDKEGSVATEPTAGQSPPNRLSSLSDDSSPIHLVTIHMKPDDEGRFGFNVKGGHDQNCPVLVSRVAPNTPADNASPKLREGDQVMTINGKDVSGLSHEQVWHSFTCIQFTSHSKINWVTKISYRQIDLHFYN